MANFTGEGNYTSKLNQALSTPPAGIAEFFSALNIFLSITAAVGNTLILIALKNVSSIHPPTKLFLRCLTVSDLCVGFLVQPLYATKIILSIIKINATVLFYIDEVHGVVSVILCSVSFWTSTAITVDRLLALLLGLRYRHVVTLRRVRVFMTFSSLIAALSGLFWLWRDDIATMVSSTGLTLCLITSIFCYTRIHLKLRHQQAQVHNDVPYGQQNGERNPLNIARYKKTVSSIMWVQLTLVACYLPFGIVTVYTDREQFVSSKVTSTVAFLNSSLNPILYCWKLGQVKQAVKSTIRQLNCF